MGNLDIYTAVRTPPDEALTPIAAGRLKGKTDINPMWRIKVLTETFGPCGIGWKYVIKEKFVLQGAKEEQAAFVDIDLYYKWNDVWSDPIPGTGGASFVALERSGLYTSDECFKMALTDAISVAAKALGVGADVYWSKAATKYGAAEGRTSDFKRVNTFPPNPLAYCSKCKKPLYKGSDGLKKGEQIYCLDCIKKKDEKSNPGSAH